jgi:hypothetical protein
MPMRAVMSRTSYVVEWFVPSQSTLLPPLCKPLLAVIQPEHLVRTEAIRGRVGVTGYGVVYVMVSCKILNEN